MAVTSIWSIKGWIGKVINYAENPDKTKENNEGQIAEDQSRSTQGLNDVITYAVNAEKIRRRQSESMEMELVGEAEELMEQYVSGVNCAPTTAREEMIAVKKRFGKEDGIVAFHGYQSFAPGECSPAMAHEIGKKMAEELWGSQYQVLIATHLDKANHLHNHFVVNSVSSLTGKDTTGQIRITGICEWCRTVYVKNISYRLSGSRNREKENIMPSGRQNRIGSRVITAW